MKQSWVARIMPTKTNTCRGGRSGDVIPWTPTSTNWQLGGARAPTWHYTATHREGWSIERPSQRTIKPCIQSQPTKASFLPPALAAAGWALREPFTPFELEGSSFCSSTSVDLRSRGWSEALILRSPEALNPSQNKQHKNQSGGS